MKTKQWVGPFFRGREYDLYEGITGTIRQIGFEFGENIPFMKREKNQTFFRLNGIEYTINNSMVLEWGDIATREAIFAPLEDFDEYTIIDIAYE